MIEIWMGSLLTRQISIIFPGRTGREATLYAASHERKAFVTWGAE